MEEEEEINGIVIVTWKTSDFVVAFAISFCVNNNSLFSVLRLWQVFNGDLGNKGRFSANWKTSDFVVFFRIIYEQQISSCLMDDGRQPSRMSVANVACRRSYS